MTLNKLLSLLPKHPRKAYEDALVINPTKDGIYLACEIYDGNESNHRLIFFDDVKQLTDFIPSLLLSNLSVKEDLLNENSVDVIDIYNVYTKFKNLKEISPEVINYLVGDWGFINVLNVGLMRTFFDVSLETVDYINNNPKIVDYDELIALSLNMSEYYILSGFVKSFNAIPSDLPSEFLDYLINLN